MVVGMSISFFKETMQIFDVIAKRVKNTRPFPSKEGWREAPVWFPPQGQKIKSPGSAGAGDKTPAGHGPAPSLEKRAGGYFLPRATGGGRPYGVRHGHTAM